MGPLSPTMILVALNCVSPLIDAESALPVERLPTSLGPIWCGSSMSTLSDPRLPQGAV